MLSLRSFIHRSAHELILPRIIRHLLLVVACGLALESALTLAGEPIHRDHPVILVFGDSLSAGYGIKPELGWVALLQQKLASDQYSYRVINASISGETTGGGLERLPALLLQYQPAVLIIELGANDGLRGYPIKAVHDNLAAMIKAGKKNQAHILLIGVQIPLNYGPTYTKVFEKSFVDVSKTYKIALAPSLLGKVPLDSRLMQKDGLHPNADAQAELLNNVWPALEPLLNKHE